MPVTVVKAGPNVVTRIRTPERDGYSAVQLAYGEISPRKVNKPLSGQYAAAKVNPRRHLAELRLDDPEATARTYDRQARLVFNVTGTPAISVPTGFSSTGLPLAMQIAGRAFDDATVYRIAHAYCAATGFADLRPQLVTDSKTAAVA